MNKIQNRFKSPVAWFGVLSAIISCLQVLEIIDLTQGKAIIAVGAALVSCFATFNNPKDKENY